jgi:hypothetical protein
MKVRKVLMPVAMLGAWLAIPGLASAHRVDEYLQATRLSMDIERVDLEIDLTAGTAMAARVFSWIDTDGDGEISNAEGEAYAREMLHSVALSVDGRPVRIALVETSYPQFREMSLGVGTIRLRATAKIPAARAGHHQVSFTNTHRSESSVYLVNALVPANPRIQLAEQRRDRAQHGLTLDYTIAPNRPPAWTFALIAGLLIAPRWLLRRAET